MKIINGYTITSSNSSQVQKASCRIKRGGVTLVLMKLDRSNPYGWIKANPQSPERREFMQQCYDAGISTEDTMAILAGK